MARWNFSAKAAAVTAAIALAFVGVVDALIKNNLAYNPYQIPR